ncbi:hypothetical protein D6851_00860 [Altericroceibacterium spongiae]|uniref:Tyr recombinase domain-containing protein n=1 Tax=Altericroceibacterium spongiae TaxID=2320269 RepID=A0A420EQX7_9SPHN|nr:hypothetical protein D6851_00860 [Altericroceibacterium spongiae]
MTKNGDERFVPLSKTAMKLQKLVKRPSLWAAVIPVQTGNFDKIFRTARRDAGLMHIHFHDSRREAASNLLQTQAGRSRRASRWIITIRARTLSTAIAANVDIVAVRDVARG